MGGDREKRCRGMRIINVTSASGKFELNDGTEADTINATWCLGALMVSRDLGGRCS